MDYLNGLMDNLNGLEKDIQAKLNTHLTPDVLEQMTPEQINFINEGRNATTIKAGQTFKEKAEQLTQILKDNASIINK